MGTLSQEVAGLLSSLVANLHFLSHYDSNGGRLWLHDTSKTTEVIFLKERLVVSIRVVILVVPKVLGALDGLVVDLLGRRNWHSLAIGDVLLKFCLV